MKTPKLYVGAIAVFCTLVLIIGSAGAAAVSGPDNSNFGNKIAHGGPVKMLDRFEEQGYDVSAIRAAVESGDNATVRTLMQQFMEAHKDLVPARNADKTNAPGLGSGMMENHLTQLEAKGYDVTAIRAAVASGDNATVRTLMQQFMGAHKDLVPARNADKTNAPGIGSGMMENHLTQLEAKGYDVTAIRAAVASGDNATVRTLMQQFMEVHKDLVPARNADKTNAPGLGSGMMENHLAQLEAKGYDVSAIRAAVESGDNATVRTLMQQFMEAHKDELPRPGAGRNRTLSRGVATK